MSFPQMAADLWKSSSCHTSSTALVTCKATSTFTCYLFTLIWQARLLQSFLLNLWQFTCKTHDKINSYDASKAIIISCESKILTHPSINQCRAVTSRATGPFHPYLQFYQKRHLSHFFNHIHIFIWATHYIYVAWEQKGFSLEFCPLSKVLHAPSLDSRRYVLSWLNIQSYPPKKVFRGWKEKNTCGYDTVMTDDGEHKQQPKHRIILCRCGGFSPHCDNRFLSFIRQPDHCPLKLNFII